MPAPPSPIPSSCDHMSASFSISVAPDGTLYALHGSTIYRFDAGAHGDAPPNAVFCFMPKKMEVVSGFVATRDEVEVLALGAIFAFDRNSRGLVNPLRYIADPEYGAFGKTSLNSRGSPYQIAVGFDGTTYVLKDTSCHCHAGGDSPDIIVFPPDGNGDIAPIRDIEPTDPAHPKSETIALVIALDGKSRLFFLDNSGDLVVSRPGAVEPYAREAHINLAAPNAFAVDNAGTAYVGHGSIIYVVTGAAGPTPAVRKLGGSKTHITNAEGLATDAKGKLYVKNCAHSSASILVFKPASSGNTQPLYILGGTHTRLVCPSLANDP